MGMCSQCIPIVMKIYMKISIFKMTTTPPRDQWVNFMPYSMAESHCISVGTSVMEGSSTHSSGPGKILCWRNKIRIYRQGWGQFHFFNSIPIPIPLFSIPIPLLTISFNSNSNSNSRDFNSNSNSNSGDFKSNLISRNDLLKSSAQLIIIMIARYM